jgi:hypothetical protein
MSPGDTISVATAGAANQQLSMTVADVTTAQAALAAGSSTKVVVTGSAKDPANPVSHLGNEVPDFVPTDHIEERRARPVLAEEAGHTVVLRRGLATSWGLWAWPSRAPLPPASFGRLVACSACPPATAII